MIPDMQLLIWKMTFFFILVIMTHQMQFVFSGDPQQGKALQ